MDLGDAKDLFNGLPRRVQRWIVRAVVLTLIVVTAVTPDVGHRATATVTRVALRASCLSAMKVLTAILPADLRPAASPAKDADPCRY